MAEGIRKEYRTENMQAYSGGKTLVSRVMMEALLAEIQAIPIPWYMAPMTGLQTFVDEYTELTKQLEERRKRLNDVSDS